MNFENKNIVKDALAEISAAMFLTVLLMVIAQNMVFVPETTTLLLDMAIVAVLATPILLMGYPSAKTFSVEIKAIIAAVIFFVIFLSQTGIILEVRKILSDPAIEMGLLVCATIAILSLINGYEIEISNSEGKTVFVGDHAIKPFIAPGLNILALSIAVIWLNPNLGLMFEETVAILYATLACIAIAIIAIAYPIFLPLIKKGNNTIKSKPNPV